MKKHVYQFNQYINKEKLKNEIYPLIANKSINQISNNLIQYLKIDNESFEKREVSIQIIDQKKDLKSYLLSFQFDVLNEEERREIVKKFESIGIKERHVDLNELSSLVHHVLINDNLLNEISSLMQYSYDKVQEILESYNIFSSESILRNFVDLLNRIALDSMVERKTNYQPIRRTKYYNENNNIVSKIVMERDHNIFSTITEFEGEIYESLSFENNEEARKYQEANNIKEDLLEDVVSVLHFQSESTLNDWYNDLTILKYRMGCMYINYGERLFVQNKKNNCSITAEEVSAIIDEFKYRDINNEFIKYVINELEQFRNSLMGKANRRVVEALPSYEQEIVSLRNFIGKINNSLEVANKLLKDDDYGNDKTIYLKIKVISDTPITFEKKQAMVLK